MVDAGTRLAEVARNLLSLEINTIVKENMTAGGMPSLPHAVLDIAGDYAQYLTDRGVQLGAFFPDPARDPDFDRGAVTDPWTSTGEGFVWRRLTISVDTFDGLRWAAHRAAAVPRPGGNGPTPAQRIICSRICANCDRIKEILKRPEAAALTSGRPNRADLVGRAIDPNDHARLAVEDSIALRKIWEIGTEQVVAQTVIHIDGDVITRIQDWVRQPGGEVVFAIHRQGIDVAVGSWRSLIDVIGQVAGGAVGGLFGKR